MPFLCSHRLNRVISGQRFQPCDPSGHLRDQNMANILKVGSPSHFSTTAKKTFVEKLTSTAEILIVKLLAPANNPLGHTKAVASHAIRMSPFTLQRQNTFPRRSSSTQVLKWAVSSAGNGNPQKIRWIGGCFTQSFLHTLFHREVTLRKG